MTDGYIPSVDAATPFEYLSPISERDIRDALGNGIGARKMFIEAVHELHEFRPHDLFTTCRPRILCRPSGEGKTTELNYIRHLYSRFSQASPRRPVEIRFDESWATRTRGDLFRFLRGKLGVHDALTLKETIELTKKRRLLILLDNVENLSEDALVWLLASVHAIEERGQYLFAETGIYIGIAGSVGLGQLSREPFSVYYTDELPVRIRDYGPDDLNRIRHVASNRFGTAFRTGALDALMQLTGGEKRTVNLLCDLLFRQMPRSLRDEGGQIEVDDVEGALSRYLDFGFRRDTRWTVAVQAIYDTREGVRVARSLAEDDEAEWIEVPSAVQKVLYNQGVVTVEAGVARPRNRVVRHLLEQSVSQFRKTRTLLSSMLPSGALLPNRVRKERRERRGDLERQAFTRAVVWICYGEVIDHNESDDSYRIRVVDEHGNTFEMELTARDFGMQLQPNQGFLKYAVWTAEGPHEEYYFYGTP